MRLSKEFDWLMRRSSVPENVSFPYSALDQSKDEIRLLRLQPREPGRALSCRLFTTSISKVDNTFYALSYSWGSPPAACQLMVNGKRFNVRDSLWNFLRSFSKQIKEPALIWIDAICIDQNATSERNHQVSMMPDIYSRAYKVCVWLGTLQASDYDAHCFINAVMGDSKSDHSKCFPNQGEKCPDRHRFARAHRQLTNRGYFKRLWVIQEVLLAKEVDVCIGNYIVSWKSWTRFWRGHLSLGKETYQPRGKESSVWERLRTRRENRSDPSATVDIGTLVAEFGEQECLDSHDRVYALLGLANPPVSFNIDYNHILAHILRQVHNDTTTAGFLQTINLTWILCRNVQHRLAKRPVECSCADCDHGILRLSEQAFGVAHDMRPSGKDVSFTSPLLDGKPFECIDARVGCMPMNLASLTETSRIRLSDTIYCLSASNEDANLSTGLALAVSKNDIAHLKPCIYSISQIDGQSISNEVRAMYCILTGLVSDLNLTWKAEESTSTHDEQNHLPQLSLEGSFKNMLEWMSAFQNGAACLKKQTLNLSQLLATMNSAGYRSITQTIRPACKGLGMRFEHDGEK